MCAGVWVFFFGNCKKRRPKAKSMETKTGPYGLDLLEPLTIYIYWSYHIIINDIRLPVVKIINFWDFNCTRIHWKYTFRSPLSHSLSLTSLLVPYLSLPSSSSSPSLYTSIASQYHNNHERGPA